MTKEEKKKQAAKAYYIVNKEKINKQTKLYRESNLEKAKNYAKEYYKTHRETIIKRAVKHNFTKRKENSTHKLADNISCLIRQTFRSSGKQKTSKTSKILGCSIPEFKDYLEKQFESWMNWNNYGKYNPNGNRTWNIDHIIPIASAISENDIICLNHYSNLRPLCSKGNLDKRAKY